MSETTAPAGSLTTAATADSASTSTTSMTSPTVTAKRGRYARIALRTVQVLIALFYAFASALPKLIAHPTAVESFDRIGWGSTGMYAIGLLELAGAIALLVPVLQSVAAVSLSALMVGAFIVQLTVFDGQNAATPLILIVPLALIAWARRRHTAELVALLRRGA
ncbi:DoxX family protein [Streptomyces sp. NPDC028635]|uniref:DoxX family protein n=1 Tax=Streptomyces sp. NPDC028635 TaxID=3154800 RepID=UPI0033FD6BE2